MTDEKQFLYTLRVTRPAMLTEQPTPEESEVVSRHFEHLQELTRRGVVILAGRTTVTDETNFGIVVFRAASEEAARGIMDADPAVAGGVMRAHLYPFRVALMGGPSESTRR